MISNIKSIFITRKVFSFSNEVIKLKLIRYNKNMQSKMNINLINYKTFSGRYIIFETKQKGKEYDSHNDKLIYEGEYLNGKRWNGTEIVYRYRCLYKKEYINGIRGDSKSESIFDENKVYKGELANGKKMEKEKNIIREN